MSIVATAAAQAGVFDSFPSTMMWLGNHWWAMVVAAFIAIYRGQRAASKSIAASSPQIGLFKS